MNNSQQTNCRIFQNNQLSNLHDDLDHSPIIYKNQELIGKIRKLHQKIDQLQDFNQNQRA
jgi:uncharacterized protein with PhoU and TrkA domain